MEQKFYKTYKITQLKFWQNFWDYYKLHILFALLVVAMMVVGIRSCVGRVNNDLMVTYIGGQAVLSSENLETFLKERAQDLDGDGQVTIEVFNSSIAETDTVDTAVTVLNRIDADLIAGDPFILMADDEYIGRFVKMGALQPLEDITKGMEISEENVLRDTVTNEIVAIDISEMPVGKVAGAIPGTKMYVSMKVMPESKEDDEDYLTIHRQTADVIRKMLEYENPAH